ncbi:MULTISPECIES: glycoside hydrolase family 88 protein [unclassified Rathayibacter]|uniref:glycoside hydrolase family 88 protein n=1 Tax=unclassified Rathayibacter TaxID=2609250 RepID=UPI0006FC8DDE|nr:MULTISPECIES: glycoside hydrolase family 88 protein [unclassified Rathayibacter]KQQ05533.1 glucuronyl hydrolase [Rathayibacter sp. Leaf294]KQS13396.1 glucuronyl hydrolase [Rathayibacter sp. Leaf185]
MSHQSLPASPGAAVAVDAPAALEAALHTVRRNMAAWGASYPDDTTVDGRYLPRPAAGGIAQGGNRGWTTSFWPGAQWLSWESTRDEAFRSAAEAHAGDFAHRVREGIDLDTHDLGFLYSLGSVTASRMGSTPAIRDDARAAALLAADHLMTRFLEPAGIIQAWGDLRDPTQAGRTIIDSLMNMPLLTWAFEQTGDRRYADAVRRHTEQLRAHILRPDDTTFHTFYWDVETGRPLRGATEQGAFDDSCWARGQAWGVYGFAIGARTTGDPGLREAAWRCARYFLAHLPDDDVPYWDLVYTNGSDAPRDSSAAAIAACGLLELAGLEPDTERARTATEAAHRLVAALIARCTPESPSDSDALLLHGVYDLPKQVGVDEGTLWGDYFYLEALVRIEDPEWVTHW